MSANIPPWLRPQNLPASAPANPTVPPWLTAHPARESSHTVGKSSEMKALLFQQYEMAFPRILEEVCAGTTVNNAIAHFPCVPPIDVGAFLRWLKKDPERLALYTEAKEIRTEVWSGEMLKHALGVDEDGTPVPQELDRSKVVIDTLKFLMKSQNRKEYGDSKQIEVNQNISIRAALEQANSRVEQIIDVDAEVLDENSYRLLPEGDGEDDDSD